MKDSGPDSKDRDETQAETEFLNSATRVEVGHIFEVEGRGRWKVMWCQPLKRGGYKCMVMKLDEHGSRQSR